MAFRLGVVAVVTLACAGPVLADVFHDYENFTEGFLGQSLVHDGVTYRDVNQVSGFFPDGQPFAPADLGNELIIENAALLYNDFPTYGSPVNSLNFGTAYIPGENLTIGPLASVWMDLEQLGNAASLDIAYYENGPWGGIEYRLDALRNGQVVATSSFFISNLGGRDNPAVNQLAVSGAEFDALHLSAWLNGEYTAPRGMIDDLAVTAVPEPATCVLLACGLLLRRR